MSRPYLPPADPKRPWPIVIKVALGAGALMTAVRIYQFKRMPRGQTINQFLLDSRVLIQGSIVVILGFPAMYDLFTRSSRAKLEASQKKSNGELASKVDNSLKKAKQAEALKKLNAKKEERIAAMLERENKQPKRPGVSKPNKTDE